MSKSNGVRSDRGFADLFREAESHSDFWEEQAIITFTEDMCLAMERVGISKAELARRLGTSQAYVTKILRGNANFTLRTMARIALALDSELHTHLVPRDSIPNLSQGANQRGPHRAGQSGAAMEGEARPRPSAVPVVR